MLLFAILGHDDNPRLSAALTLHFPGNYLRIGNGQWLVAGGNTTVVDVSNILGISDGTNGSGIVISIASYYGRANTNIWEWMKVKLSAP
jgi:hypothetical protein